MYIFVLILIVYIRLVLAMRCPWRNFFPTVWSMSIFSLWKDMKYVQIPRKGRFNRSFWNLLALDLLNPPLYFKTKSTLNITKQIRRKPVLDCKYRYFKDETRCIHQRWERINQLFILYQLNKSRQMHLLITSVTFWENQIKKKKR